MRVLASSILRSFPVQLLLLHLRHHLLLLLVWLLLVLMMSGVLGPQLGLQYLFLDPEYLNDSGYWAYVLVGLAFGFFTMSWNLSTYLLLGGYFNFLASLARPFFKYCVNNALLPLAVLFFYAGLLTRFHWPADAGGPEWTVLTECLSGLFLGVTASLFLYAIYFNVTNRDINYYYDTTAETPPNQQGPSVGERRPEPAFYRGRPLTTKLLRQHDNPYRVRTYLTERLTVRLVRSVAHYDPAWLRGVFRQNHGNALLLQLLTMLLLVGLGFMIDQPAFQIPAGASFLVLFSLVVSIIGAVSYWFSEWRLVLLVLLAVAFNALTSTNFFSHENRAYGLDYQPTAAYSPAVLDSIFREDVVTADIAATKRILDRWRARQPEEKPPFIIVCASGGGLTAALWSLQLSQVLEEASDGRLLSRTALMTGASGGQLGLAYLREAYRRDSGFVRNAGEYADRISRDLLNPVAFSIVSNDLFLPFTTVEVAGRSYRRDRAYNFEREFNLNTRYWLDRPLASYAAPERRADIPLLFVTPSIVNDGRRMVISPQGVSYMMAPPAARRTDLPLKPDMVDFRRLLAANAPDSLRFSTALRANATYPYILPLVKLPTRPTLRLMDAGYRDNYGIAVASRFVTVFKDWLLANTSGVHIIQFSAFREKSERRLAAASDENSGVLETLVSPVGVAGNILGVQILDQETLLGQLSDLLGPDRFHLHRFNYQPAVNDDLRSSISLHLTEQERRQLLRRIEEVDLGAVVEVLR